jgi:ABC-type Fe3+-siderophore transport system permease subunit
MVAADCLSRITMFSQIPTGRHATLIGTSTFLWLIRNGCVIE